MTPPDGVPDPRGLVVRCGDDAAAVRAESGGIDSIRVSLEPARSPPESASQIRAVLSSEAVTMRATVSTECGGNHLAPVSLELGDQGTGVSRQTRAVLSLDAVMTRVPSGLNAAELTWSVCPLSSARRAPCQLARPAPSCRPTR